MSTSERVRRGAVAPSETEMLVAALGALAADTEALLAATTGVADDGVAEIRARADESLKVARSHTAGMQDRVLAKARAAGRATDAYVREHRWEVLAASALAGAVLGVWIGREGASDRS